MKYIPVTKGNTMIVDDADYERVVCHSWCLHAAGYAKARINKKYVLMHRWLIDAPDGLQVDHVNGNKLDNQRSNLRLCTCSQNHANRFSVKSVWGYKGVNLQKGKNRFRVRVGNKLVGFYETVREAALAYNRVALEEYGEFARLNEIPMEENHGMA